MTMNKGLKMKSGWKAKLKNETMSLTLTRTTNFVKGVRVSLNHAAKLKSSNSCHRENTAKPN